MYISTNWQNFTQTAKLKPNQGIVNSDIIFYQKTLTFKIETWTRTNLNTNNGNEAKSDIFPWDIFKSDNISFLPKNIKVFPWLSKSKFLSFMTKLNPKNGNEQNQIFFHGAYSNLTLFFIGCKIRKYLNDFYRGSFSTSLQMWVQTIIVKQNHTGNVQICQYFSLFTA